MPTPQIELLAPAGDFTCLEAALEAGADAVYLGLTSLNARRRARNFSALELARACELVHARGRRLYLTLNIDLAQSELSEAARMLELARQRHVDAVLIRDPALLALRPLFPELEFHFSTQSCVASSADVEAAKELGISRVVLAREMTLEEIAQASECGVETEVFVQGALCFSVSGRCLLASWVGGRSGNRGQCTSPCRVPWTVDGEPQGTPLSMHDLAVVTRIDELRKAGVRALKIEGRLKTAAWVRTAVSLYRRAIDGTASLEELAREAEALGAYTGRRLTDGYLDGRRDGLTGVSGRERVVLKADPSEPERPTGYSLRIDVGKRIECNWSWNESIETFDHSRAEIRREGKAIRVSELLERLSGPIEGVAAGEIWSNDPKALIVPRTANAIEQQVQTAVRRALRSRKQLEAPLSADVSQAIELAVRSGLRSRIQPNRVRVGADQATAFLSKHPVDAIVEGLDADRLATLVEALPQGASIIPALPAVFFEGQRPGVERLLAECASRKLAVEANSWGGWLLAKRLKLQLIGGPGLGILNPLAARELKNLGFSEATSSTEADAEQLAGILSRSELPISVVVFGRPALMTTRVALGSAVTSGVLEDRRSVRLQANQEGALWQLRPLEPFDLRGRGHPAAHLVVDLVGSPDPFHEWVEVQPRRSTFNLDRTLT